MLVEPDSAYFHQTTLARGEKALQQQNMESLGQDKLLTRVAAKYQVHAMANFKIMNINMKH